VRTHSTCSTVSQEAFANVNLKGIHAASLSADELLDVLRAALVARKFKVRATYCGHAYHRRRRRASRSYHHGYTYHGVGHSLFAQWDSDTYPCPCP